MGCTIAQAAITDGLLVAHDFSDLVDDSGNGHNAVLGGSAYISGGLLYLQGDGGYADIGPETFGPVNPIVDGLSDFTIAIAYASTNTGPGGEGGGGMLLSVGPIATAASSGDFSLFTNNDGQYIDHWWVTARGSDQSGVGYADGTVHLAIVTYEATTDTYTFYHLDGGAAVSHGSGVFPDWSAAWDETLDYTPRIGTSANVNVDLDFGPAGDGAWAYLDGQVDMVAIWNRVLTISEIPEIPNLSVTYVDADAPGPTHDGLSWGTAFKYLQDALDNAQSGDQIRVAEGIYKPDEDTAYPDGSGAREATFQLISGVAIYGGYAGFDQPDPDARDIGVHETILSGDLNSDDVSGLEEPGGGLPGENCAQAGPIYLGVTNFDTTGSTTDGPWDCSATRDIWYVYTAEMTGMLNVSLCGSNYDTYLGIYEGVACPPTNLQGCNDDYCGPGSGSEVSIPVVQGNDYLIRVGGWSNRTGTGIITITYNNYDRQQGENSYHVVTGSGTNATAVLDGFTITAGNANSGYWPHGWGGGMFNHNSSPTLTNCIFSDNSAKNGAGMHNNESDLIINNCTFSRNSVSESAGGMDNVRSSPTLTNCTFSDNSSDVVGGGMANFDGSSPTLTNCTFSDNSTGEVGGGMVNYESSPTLTNCTFIGNSAGGGGGGMWNEPGNPTLTNCTFSSNSAGWSGGGMNNSNGSSPTLTNCILWGNTAQTGPQIYNDEASSATVSYSCVQGYVEPTQGPIAHWRFDEGQGDIAYDSVGDNNGTIYGAEWTTGQVDGALEFDGVDDWVEVANSASLNPTQEISIEAWIFLHSKNYHNVIVAKANSFTNGYYFLVNRNSEGGVLVANIGDGGGYLRGPAININEWYHVAATYNATKEILYVNGVKVAEKTSRPLIPTSSNLRIGLSTTAYWGGQFFNGLIDDVHIYDRALSAEEIRQIYQEGEGGLISHWRFDEGQGDTAYDSVGENDGTLINGPTWTTGQIGGALSFDGVDDYVDLTDFTLGEYFSISLWVNPSRTDGGRCFIGKHTLGGSNIFILGVWADGYLARIRDDWYTSGTPTTGWQHVVAIVEQLSPSTSNVTVYKNGEVLWYQTLNDVVGNMSGLPWTIGQDWDGGPSRTDFFNGTIDDVRIYNRALSAEEIEQLYQSGSEGNQGQGNIGADPGFVNPEYLWPTSYLKLDEGEGDTAYDSTGDNDGTLIGDLNWTNGIIDGALNFDGAGDYVDFGNKSIGGVFGSGSSVFTVSGWIKPGTLGSSASNHGTRNVILARASDGYNDNFELGVSPEGDLDLYIDENGDDITKTYGGGEITTGSWHHFVCVFDSGPVDIYLDENHYQGSFAGSSLDEAAGSPVTVGATLHSDIYFNGLIDDIRIYDRALSVEEIQQIYEIGLSGYSYPDVASPDYHLLPTSPCIDAGDNTAVPADITDLDGDGNTTEPIPFDLDGNPRIVDGSDDGNSVVDMGAYEYTGGCTLPPEPNNPDPYDGAIDVPMDTNLAWDIEGCSGSCDLANGGFEDGGFAQWTTVTGPGNEETPWNVSSGGTGWFQNGFPFEGGFFAQNGFDGDAGLFYDIYQEVTIPACASFAVLNWSERIQWNMIPYGATLPRQYIVSIQPAGGGVPLAVLYMMFLDPGTSGDTEYVSHSVNLLSAVPGMAGQTIRINFHEYIPESRTGPAQFDLDGIDTFSFTPAPEYPTTWDVYLSTDPCALELVCEDLNEPNCDPTPGPGEKLNAHTTYYWQVVAKNAAGETEGDEWSFTTENTPPLANAGPNQIAYAWIDNIAEVVLDGNDSNDPDGDELTYLWTWTIGPTTYETNSVNPAIELPVGEHSIKLIVNDGLEDSEPDEVTITVIEPIESRLWILPRVIDRHSQQRRILAWVHLPEGVTRDQIDSNEPLLLYPDVPEANGIEAIHQYVFQNQRRRSQRTSILAFFDKAELMDAVGDDGSVKLQVVGNLRTGQYFYGTDTVWITDYQLQTRAVRVFMCGKLFCG